jgi:hypothetical protein
MSRSLVVHLNRTTYLVTPSPETLPLTRARRKVEIHTWADGQVEIQYEGRKLPFTVCDEYPLVTPGDVVERRRIAEVMAEVQKAQRDPDRSRVAARIALRTTPVVPPVKEPSRPVAPPSSVLEMGVAGTRASDFEATPESYVIRWVRKRAHLYLRSFAGEVPANGRPLFKETYLGEVACETALGWQKEGDVTKAPPLIDGPLPSRAPARLRRPPRCSPTGSQDPASTATAAAPSSGPPIERRARLDAAVWFAGSFHAAEADRIRQCTEAAAAETAAGSPCPGTEERRSQKTHALRPLRKAAVR